MGLTHVAMVVVLLALVFAAKDAVGVANPRGLGVCTTFIHPEGYLCYEFTVETADGYKLALQRVTKNSSTSSPTMGPVLVYHGIMQGGDIWVLNPVEQSLAFILADAGYDVFIGNGRSSIFSSHNLFSRSDSRFWDWSLDELVVHDLPSMLTYINVLTDRKVFFVGYSQGTQVAFAALTQGGNKAISLIDRAAMLAPITYLNHVRAPLLEVAARLYADQALLRSGVSEFNMANAGGRQLLGMVCRAPNMNCLDNMMTMMTGPNCCINVSRVAYYNMYELQSTSAKNIAHLAQLVRSGRFAKYDFGVVGNMEHYGSLNSPSYSLSTVSANIPLLLIYGGRDDLADQTDVQHLIRDLHRTSVQVLFLPRYAHADFVLGTSSNVDVYPHVLEFLQASGNQTSWRGGLGAAKKD